ncbi:MAG: hypothetical protein RLZZ324_183 [Candidatus Parcubacteria bacterium]|jgi:hypothetical protein
MEDLTRVQLLTALSSQGIPADAVATFVTVLSRFEPAAGAELTAMLIASPKVGKDFWHAAKDKMKASSGALSVEAAVEGEIKGFQSAIDELM